MTNSLPDF